MSDIVEHLRRQASKQDMLTCEDMLQAAAEIEQLQADLAEERRLISTTMVENLRANNERLQASLDDERKAHQVCVEMRNDAERKIERLRAQNEDLNRALESPCPHCGEKP